MIGSAPIVPWRDWAHKTIKFENQGQVLKLTGMLPATSSVPEVSMNTMDKWLKGNDIWSMAVVQTLSQDIPTSNSPQVEQVLHQYKEVFTDPKILPP